MNNTSNTSSTCGSSAAYIKADKDMYFFVFFILTPIYFFVAFTGHILCLIGFIRRARSEPAYSYQIYLTAAKTLEIVFFTIFVISFKWLSGIENQGATWYERDYTLMWYAAHASFTLSNSCISTSLFMSVVMTLDRLFAVWKPFVYRNINQKRYHLISVIVCFLLGWSTSVFDWFRYDLEWNGSIYKAKVNTAFVGGLLSNFLANIRNALRAGAVIALVVCNIILVRLFSRHAKVKPAHKSDAATTAVEQRQAKRKSSERNLVIIVVTQSVFTSITIFLFVTYYVLSYATPAFIFCSGVMFASVMDGMLEVSDMAIFLIVVLVDKKVRVAILTTIMRKKFTGLATTKTEVTQMSRANPQNVNVAAMPEIG